MSKIANVAVIGAGTMGHALALVHALGHAHVRLTDANPATLDRAKGLIESAASTLIEGGLVTDEEAGAAIDRIEPKTDLGETLQDSDLIVEAIVESIDAKKALFAAIDDEAPDGAIIASNTSYLDPFPLIADRRQARSLIVHWYTPPYIIDLVDIAGGPKTDPALLTRMRDYYAGLGKRPVVFERLVQGYIANRLQSALNLEILHLLDEGLATPEDIDTAIIHGLAQRLALQGQLGKADFTGLDMMRRALANKVYQPPVPTGKSRTLDALIESGRTGVMSGAGFHDYGGRPPAELLRERDLKLMALKKALATIEQDYAQ